MTYEYSTITIRRRRQCLDDPYPRTPTLNSYQYKMARPVSLFFHPGRRFQAQFGLQLHEGGVQLIFVPDIKKKGGVFGASSCPRDIDGV
jgi:hypothetical protein